MRSITIYIPQGHGIPSSAYTSAQIQKLWYLLDKCRYYAEESDGAFYLHKEYHSEQIGSRGFTWAKGVLLQMGILCIIPYINKAGGRYAYCTGKAARYSLRPDLVEAPLEPVQLGWVYLKKYLQSSQQKTEQAAAHFPDLVERVKASELDYSGARAFVDGHTGYTPQQRGWRLRLISGWQQGFKWVKYSERSGRLFTCITCLPKDMRSFLRWPGVVDLVEVDAKNSQPYLLSALCYYATGHTDALEVASRGEFYEQIQILCPDLSRGEVKKGVLMSLYDSREDPWHPAGKALALRFPDLWRWVGAQDRSSGSDGHLAIQMQQLEAEWFLGTATQLAVEFPDPVATIHDSLILPEDLAERSRYILEEFCRVRYPNIPVLESLPINS